jgi:hypothetical protein
MGTSRGLYSGQGILVLQRAIVFALACLAGASQQAHTRSALLPAQGVIDQFVKEAIESLVAGRAIPDMNLIKNHTHVPILETVTQMSWPTRLSRAAIPDVAGYGFYLTSLGALNTEADRTGITLFFLTVEGIRMNPPSPLAGIADTSASAVVGVDLVLPSSSKAVKTCCCVGQFEFTFTNGHWVFVKRGNMICS